MSDLFQEPDNATPLTPDEKHQLIPAHIAYRSELNEAEQENIARAQDWALGRRRNLLREKFIKDLHRRMLGDVWRWAGKFRTSERNLGIAPFPNGNGRHARLMADLLVMSLAGERLSWGRASLRNAGNMRQRYIAALAAADKHDIGPLLAFARS